MLTVKSRDGQTTYKVKLTDNAAVRGIVKAALTDIKDNSFIGGHRHAAVRWQARSGGSSYPSPNRMRRHRRGGIGHGI
jgi:hypothetical protein